MLLTEDGDEFAAMVKDMQEVLMLSGGDAENQDLADGRQRPSQGGILAAVVEGDEDDESGDGFQEVCLEWNKHTLIPGKGISCLI